MAFSHRYQFSNRTSSAANTIVDVVGYLSVADIDLEAMGEENQDSVSLDTL
jgi:hypothetical protein